MSSSQNFVYDKSLTARIRWTEPMELTLAQNADAKEVLYRTKIGAAEKWKQIHSDLTNHYFFREVAGALTPDALRKKWERLKGDVIKKFALEREGANISAIVDASEVENYIIAMVKKQYESVAAREAVTQKKKEDQAKMLSYEKSLLGGPPMLRGLLDSSVGSSTSETTSSLSANEVKEDEVVHVLKKPRMETNASAGANALAEVHSFLEHRNDWYAAKQAQLGPRLEGVEKKLDLLNSEVLQLEMAVTNRLKKFEDKMEGMLETLSTAVARLRTFLGD